VFCCIVCPCFAVGPLLYLCLLRRLTVLGTYLRCHYLRGPRHYLVPYHLTRAYSHSGFLRTPTVVSPTRPDHNFDIRPTYVGFGLSYFLADIRPLRRPGYQHLLPLPSVRAEYASCASTLRYQPCCTILRESTATNTTTDLWYPMVDPTLRYQSLVPTPLPYLPRPTAGLRHPTAFLIRNQIAVPGPFSTAVFYQSLRSYDDIRPYDPTPYDCDATPTPSVYSPTTQRALLRFTASYGNF